MTIVVASDSHYARAMLMNLAEEIRRRGDIDAVIHLGDMEGDAEWLRGRLTIPVYSVPGNCDMKFNAPAEVVATLGGVKVMMCHGHAQRVKYTLDPLAYRAMELGVSVALFGHTHARCLRNEGGVLLLNPGALKDGRYALIEIENGDIKMPRLLEL
ncbi:MAG: metallophosphoesterase [Clostridia bacterium]|nr:metallophosphoesterase [Clostridia bacterium]MBO4886341.1 metallophosphoesterase [Clostridia bacterium]MBR4443707.1 metallophosphoesterase [Clostridia bacterium]